MLDSSLPAPERGRQVMRGRYAGSPAAVVTRKWTCPVGPPQGSGGTKVPVCARCSRGTRGRDRQHPARSGLKDLFPNDAGACACPAESAPQRRSSSGIRLSSRARLTASVRVGRAELAQDIADVPLHGVEGHYELARGGGSAALRRARSHLLLGWSAARPGVGAPAPDALVPGVVRLVVLVGPFSASAGGCGRLALGHVARRARCAGDRVERAPPGGPPVARPRRVASQGPHLDSRSAGSTPDRRIEPGTIVGNRRRRGKDSTPTGTFG